MPEVLNRRRDILSPDSVYVGRPSKWGNPFSHLEHTSAQHKVSSVAEAIEKYEAWITQQPDLMADLHELTGRDLVCWCAPGPCHARVLLRLANPS